MTDSKWQQDRSQAMTVKCPQCRAEAGDACIVRGKPAAVAYHLPRGRKAGVAGN